MRNSIYPHVDDVIKNNVCIALEDGSHNVFYVDLGRFRLVYKSLFSKKTTGIIVKTLKKLDEPFRNYYNNQLSAVHVAPNHPGETFDIEYRVLDEWKKRNISCMQILERQDKALVYQHLNAINFSRMLRNKGDYDRPYRQLLDVVDSIRSAAKNENNPMLLHPDLLPKNFLYVFDSDSVIAIDPGVKLKNLPLEKLDASINLTFVRDLNIYPNGDFYINEFLGILNKEEKQHIRELNTPIRPDVFLYFDTKRELYRIVTGNSKPDWLGRYSYEKINHLNRLLDTHIG